MSTLAIATAPLLNGNQAFSSGIFTKFTAVSPITVDGLGGFVDKAAVMWASSKVIQLAKPDGVGGAATQATAPAARVRNSRRFTRPISPR
jgi:hypothetical protein